MFLGIFSRFFNMLLWPDPRPFLAAAHGLAIFNQRKPLLVRVELTVPKHGNSFPANLKQARDTVRRIHPGIDVVFDLTVLAVGRESHRKVVLRVRRSPGFGLGDLWRGVS